MKHDPMKHDLIQHEHGDLRRHLRALPDPDPPAALRERVLNSHGRRRRVVRSVTGATAAMLLVVVVAPGLLQEGLLREQDPAGAPPSPVAETPARASGDTLTHLRAIDRALQAAYERGASDDELAPLWKARESLLVTALPDRNPS